MKYVVIIIAVIIVLGGLFLMFGPGPAKNTAPTPTPPPSATPPPAALTPPPAAVPPSSNTTPIKTTMIEGMKVETLTDGSGTPAKAGDTVSVDYTGTLTNGTVFDSSIPRGQPFSFPLGGGRVIRGWDLGVAGMKVGEKRRLTIPPELGYGAQANGPIPANSTLIFEVQMLKIN